MKRTLIGIAAVAATIGTPALAADMPLKAPPPPPAPAWSWTACYIGANAGIGWSRQEQTRVDSLPLGGGAPIPAPAAYGSESDSSLIGGGQIGCDYQFAGPWVIGVQGQFDWGNLDGSHASGVPFGSFTMNDRTRNFDTATARVGYAFQPNVLAYVKGGGAWVHNNDALIGIGPPSFLSESAAWNASGWTVGGGLEYRIMGNWSVFAEYDYLGFGTKTIRFIAPPGLSALGEDIAISQNVQEFKFGINYRFNWWGGGPIATRY